MLGGRREEGARRRRLRREAERVGMLGGHARAKDANGKEDSSGA